ncbi:hypothetical protein HK097_006602 [Rhizophlyctis rosea]|uniref:Ankyrin n=1 Tax=Rhizophlyctis rosea TaxID=64517 RepID=A0AAD5SFL3_9FUNG|nr:hypothetical protein HK097_006602 [Rhizophlyctis rosea]
MTSETLDLSTFDTEEFIACARYGELPELQSLISTYLSTLPPTLATSPQTLTTLYTIRTPSQSTALHYASANGHLPIITHILPHIPPSFINATNDDGSTPLHWAALNGQLEVVQELLKAGANATLKNSMGRSAVTLAEQQGHLETVQALLGSYDPEEEDDDGAEEVEGGASGSKDVEEEAGASAEEVAR